MGAESGLALLFSEAALWVVIILPFMVLALGGLLVGATGARRLRRLQNLSVETSRVIKPPSATV